MGRIRKIGSAHCNYSQILYQFLTFTQNLKRSPDQTGLTVKGYNSGPLGGDQQIGAKIVEGVIDFVIFFSDPLTAQPHDPDVKALMRISQVYDIPMAVNKSTADFMITSCYMNLDYKHEVINFKQHIADRAETL